jgi:predicted alpha/beta-hydrolase family hydrolase
LKNPSELRIEVSPGASTTALVYAGADALPTVRPGTPGPTLILAHGAGAGQQSPFMVAFAQAIATLGVDVVTFNFLYTEQRRHVPDRAPVLEACYRAVIERVSRQSDSARGALFIGGKSMGGRIATQVAAADRDLDLAGLVLLGYPLHPPGQPERRRDAHLPAVKRPMLFVQGSRDTFGTPAELSAVLETLDPTPALHVVAGGDHSFKRSRKDPAAQAAVYDDVQRTVVEWIARMTM